MGVDIEKILAEAKPVIDERIAKFIPREYDAKSIEFTCGKARYSYDVETATKSVSEPIWNLLDRGEKGGGPHSSC